MPLYPEMLQTGEHAATPPFVVFTFGFAVESIQESGGVSHGIKALVELDPPIGEFQWH
jgi:hypothetical protein